MPSHPHRLACLCFFLAGLSNSAAEPLDKLKVGRQTDGSVVVPTNQVITPAGTHVEFPGRPVDLLVADGGKAVVVKNMRDLTVLDLPSGKVRQVLPLGAPGRPSGGFSAVGLAAIGDKVLATIISQLFSSEASFS